MVFRRPPDPSNYNIDVDMDASYEIAEAAPDRQPHEGEFLPRRYVTVDDRFKLNLSFKELRSFWRRRSQAMGLGSIHNTDNSNK